MTRRAALALRLVRGAAMAVLLAPATAGAGPLVNLETTEGSIVIELDAGRAPKTVAHFLELVRSGFYEGTVFHRVIPGHVIQGGGFDARLDEKEDERTIENESRNGLGNERGTIAMARTSDPHSANSQFYINLKDNTHLDATPDRWGYTVFGRVVGGMEVVDAIATYPTGPGGRFDRDVPFFPIIIRKVSVAEAAD